MDAIVTAGGIPQPDEPLYAHTAGSAKALVDVAGKAMVQWVLDALGGAERVDNIIVVGLSPKSELTCQKPLHFVSNQGRLLANIVAGIEKALELNPAADYVLMCTADIPTLKPGMVDWLVDTAMQTRHDLYYGVCPREVMEKRFPASKRTFTRLKDMEVCGADIHVAHVSLIRPALLEKWEQLIGNRKSPMRQAAIIGLGTGWLYLTRQLTLQAGVQRVSGGIGIRGRAIIWSQAEPAMDVDKPHQLEIVRRDLARQLRAARPRPRKAAAAARPAKRTTRNSSSRITSGRRAGSSKRSSKSKKITRRGQDTRRRSVPARRRDR